MENFNEIQFYKTLVQRYAANTATEEELEVFFHLLAEGKLEKYLQQDMDHAAAIKNEEVPVRKMFNWRRIAVAASILLVVGLSTYFIFFNKSRPTEIAKTPPQDVKAPASNRAMITLADGKTVYLDSAANGELAMQNNVKVVKTADGQIVYEGSSLTTHDSPLTFNTLTNRRGSKVIDMTLADGSRVWLNAGSSITYPVAFVSNERKISISGEAYFEVSHDASKPFIVSKGETSVQVLGTHFNVNAYDDETDIKITLLEGSVKVSNGSSSGLLKPGQQAQISSELKIINGVDVDEIIAWKNGKFQFGEKADIGTIMRQIARWYDVDVEYKGTFTKHFGGTISREVNVSQVLKVLETTGDVKCNVEGRKVTVMPL